MATAANPTRTPSGILTFIGGVLVLAIFAALVVLWVKSTGPKTSIDDRRAQLRKEAAAKLEQESAEKLAGKGWVDRDKGIARIPIADAMQLALVDLKGKQPGPSQMKLVPALPMPVADPNSTEPPRPLLPSAPQGADTVRFPVPGQQPEPAPAPAPAAPVEKPAPAPVPAPKPAPATTAAPPAAGPASEALLAEGKKQYVMICGACHQPTGAGLPPVFPPLINTEYVKGDPKRLIAIMLKGVIGPITVDGKPYNNIMPGQGAMLTDKTIAAIGSFVRKEYGAGASPITPELSAEVRKEYAARVQPWTEAELKAFGGAAAPGAAPAQPAATPAEPEAAPAQPGATPAEPEAAPAEPEAAPAQPGAAPAQPGAAPAQPGAAPAQPGAAPAQPEAAPAQPAATPTQPGAAPTQPEAAPAQTAPASPQSPAAPAPAPAENADPAPASAPQASASVQVRPSLINWTESK